eukprot:TRINITY_DN68995_c0_g1_i1.p1 TRINITY_DN68995_c0_g1~~TRINITY_DN68995_c0_g1_i1.p1  ORF type:complete len:462 (-),score=64.23 TRINITY_DN68995_c0_g1_i1:30-1370(-)
MTAGYGSGAENAPEDTTKGHAEEETPELKLLAHSPMGKVGSGPLVFSLDEQDDEEVEVEICSPPELPLNTGRTGTIISILCVLAAIAIATWCGVQIGAQQQLRDLEGRRRFDDGIMPNSTDATSEGSAGCSADVCLDENRNAFEGHRLGDENSTTDVQHVPSAETKDAAQSPTTPSPSQQVPPHGAGTDVADAVDEYPDLTCDGTPHPEWKEIKGMVWQAFGSWRAGTVAMPKTELQQMLNHAVARLSAVHNKVEECGMGRLSMTLLAICAGEPGSSLKGVPGLHSPLLTVLLDVPWGNIVRSGWPLFGVLAQLNLQQQLKDDLPTAGPSSVYFNALKERLSDQRVEALAALGAEFIQLQEESGGGAGVQGGSGNEGRTHVMPALCALASQLFSPGVLTGPEPDVALHHMQNFFRQAVNNIQDMQSTIDSTWPLYAVVNGAASQLR